MIFQYDMIRPVWVIIRLFLNLITVKLFVVLKTAAVVGLVCVLDCVILSVSVCSRFVLSF